jgi:hypothetical protein
VSLYPCELCRQRVPGALESIRVTVLYDNANYSRRMRLCASHIDQVLEASLRGFTELEFGSTPAPDHLCDTCHADLDSAGPSGTAFAWVYRKGSDPRELIAGLCGVHVVKTIKDLELQEQAMRS